MKKALNFYLNWSGKKERKQKLGISGMRERDNITTDSTDIKS